jgi:hypothetical protein
MKKIALFVIIILYIFNALNAQDEYEEKGHYKHCDVIDINDCTQEEFECMWIRARKNIITGSILTTVGTSFAAFFIAALTDPNSGDYINSDAFGFIILFGGAAGIVLYLIGIPTLVNGLSGRSQLKKTDYYDVFKTGSLNIQPTFGLYQINYGTYVGLSLSWSF